MNSTFAPSGNVDVSTRAAPRSSASNAATSATGQTRCGLPTDEAMPAYARPATVTVASPVTTGRGSTTVIASGPISTATTPARVATSSRVVSGATSRDDSR